MKARLQLSDSDHEISVDLSRPIDIAIALDFRQGPRHFGAPAATTRPFSVEGFSGTVAGGASCNCNVVSLIPHCNGTHTECVGHLTTDPADVSARIPKELVTAVLVSVTPVSADTSTESTDPAPRLGDRLVTRRALVEAWPSDLPFTPRGLVIRTLPNEPAKAYRDYSESTPPYLTREAAALLVERGIEHLLVDLPSIDRSHDEGRLTAHRVFFGLPPHSQDVLQAQRPQTTITELAYIANQVADGPYLLQIQSPAWSGDAVPSRPLLYAV